MLVGLDLGFGHAKWTTDGVHVQTIPAVASPTWGDADVRVDGAGYVVGENAERDDPAVSPDVTPNRMESAATRALLGYLLVKAAPETPVDMVSGLPYSATETDQQRYREGLLRFAGPIQAKGQLWRGPISSVKLFRQAQAALIDVVFDEHNQPRRPEFLREGLRVALIDVGFKTTDVVVAELFPRYVVMEPLSGSVEIGISDVEQHLQRDYQRRFGAETLDRQQLRLVLQGKSIVRFSQLIELSTDAASARVAEQIMTFVRARWKKAEKTIHHVFLAGGGAALLAHRLLAVHEAAEIVPDPQGANARGFYKLGQFTRK